MSDQTANDLDAIDAMLAAATPGQWQAWIVYQNPCGRPHGWDVSGPHSLDVGEKTRYLVEGDAALIAACPTLVKSLRDEVAALRSELAAYRHLDRKIAHGCIDANCSVCDGKQP